MIQNGLTRKLHNNLWSISLLLGSFSRSKPAHPRDNRFGIKELQ